MSLFGENPGGAQISNENPLGLNRAPEEAANTGQPDNTGTAGNVNDGIGTGNIGNGQQFNNSQPQVQQPQVDPQNQPQQGQELDQSQNVPQREEQIDNINENDVFEKKTAFIRQKFPEGQDKFLQSVEELQKKLGRENEDVKFDNAEQVIDYYITLERELGKTSNVDNTRQENQMMKKEIQGLRNALNQMMVQSQQYNVPGNNQFINQAQQGTFRNPQNGQFMQRYNKMANQQIGQPLQPNNQQNNNDLDINFDNIDTNQFMKEFYEKGPNAESFKKVIQTVAEKIADQKVNNTLTKQQEEQKKIQQQQQMARYYKIQFDNQVKNIKQQYGEQEFESNKQGMVQMFRQYPMYLNPKIFPNGFEIVFNEVRNMNNSYQRQQNTLQNQQQYNTAQKKVAGIGKSKPGQRFSSNQLSQEEMEINQIVNPQKSGGLFG